MEAGKDTTKELENMKILYYSALTAVVFIAHVLSGFLEDMVVAGNQLALVWLFIWYTAFLAGGDYLIKRYAL